MSQQNDPEQRASKYERAKLTITLIDIGVSVAIPLALIVAGWSIQLREATEGWSGAGPAALLLYTAVLVAGLQVLTFPLDIYSGYVLE
ncbi:MAG: hypothetical protein HY682_00890, partial [Chloroflexi bacterium]|nr:hypothetical protein [Chloroflexota bacterium]